MRALLVCLCLCIPLLGSAEWSGEVRLLAEWRFPSSPSLAGRVGLSYVQGPFSFGASGEIPLTSPSSWRASLRVGLSLAPFTLGTRVGFVRTGPDYVEGSVSFSPPPWEVAGGDLKLRGDLRVSLRDPLGSSVPSASGNASVRHEIGDFWGEASMGFTLYPPPPSPGRKTISLGYSPGGWWISVRNSFDSSWDRTSLEVGYRDDPLGITARGEFAPAGFSRASVAFSLSFGDAWVNARFGFTPQGHTSPRLSFGRRGGGWDVSLSVTLAIPLRPDFVRLEISYRF
ncbi:MAG: hypothetical protein GXO72_00225 [Caldiserica bacterium]|nr:hypothetical protein [Caldisericota bacterium]